MPRDEGRGPGAGAEGPAAVPAPQHLCWIPESEGHVGQAGAEVAGHVSENAKTDEGRIRLTAAYLRGLAHESAGAPAIPDDVHDEPMDAVKTSRQHSVEDAGHKMNDVRRDGSMGDESMQEARRDAEALGAEAVALVEAHSQTGIHQRAGAFGLSAGVAMDLRLGWDLGLEADQSKAQKRY